MAVSPNYPRQEIDGEALRMAMRHVPSPVAVVTVGDEVERRGITIGSFVSTSLEPPLISFNVGLDAQMHDVLAASRHFALHLLSDDQAFLSDHFAIPDRTGEEQFAGIMHRVDGRGVPVLAGALFVLHCTVYARYDAGDHSIFVGHVEDIEGGEGVAPLVYYDRSYRSVGEEVTSSLLSPVKRGSSEMP